MAAGKFHLAIHAPLDRCTPQRGTMTLDRATGLVTVRPLRARRVYTMTVDWVAGVLVQAVLKAEARAAAAERKARARSVRRGVL